MTADEAAALQDAARALGRRSLSRAETVALLLGRGHAAPQAEFAARWLERHGYLDDRAVAEREAQKAAARGRGRLALEQTLERREIEPDARPDALRALDPATEASLALAAVRRRFPEGAEPAKAARFLAARGFSEEAARSALDAVAPGWEDAGDAP
jgi:SOS response regulatory protein OraA/RecX